MDAPSTPTSTGPSATPDATPDARPSTGPHAGPTADPDGSPATAAPAGPGTAQQLAYTSWLRVIAIVGVVFIHVAGLTYINPHLKGSSAWWLAATMDYGFKWAVPVFVMVSGAVILRPPATSSARGFYRRRLARLGIPLVFWHAVYVTLVVTVVSPGVPASRMVASILTGKAYTALYFFWLILGLYALVPLLWPLVRALGQRQLALAGAGLAAVPAADAALRGLISLLRDRPVVDAPPTLATQFVPYVGFLLLGHALGQVVLRGKALVAVALAWVVLSTELVLQAALVGDPTSHVGKPRGLGALLVAVSPLTYQGAVLGLAAVALFVLVRSLAHPSSALAAPAVARRMRSLGDLTFGVFACHLLVFAVLARLPGVDLVKGAESVPGVLGLSGTVVVLAFVATAVLRRVPGLRRVV